MAGRLGDAAALVRAAGLACGRMKAKRTALIEALTGRFDDHHAELAAILLARSDVLHGQT